jgi:hypothetical protein
MTCRDVLRSLDEDGILPATADEHLAACAACRDAYKHWRAARQGLRDMGRDEPPPFLHARMMAGMRAAQRAPAHRSWRPLWIAPLVVTTFVAATGVWLWRHRSVDTTERASVPELAASPSRGALRSLGRVRSEAAPSDKKLDAAQRAQPQVRTRAAAPQAVERPAAPRSAPATAPELALEPVDGIVAGLVEPRKQKEEADKPAVTLKGQDDRAREGEAAVAEERIAGPRADEEAKSAVGRLVGCSLVALGGAGEARSVSLPVGAAPPTGVAWEVAVSASGDVMLLLEQGNRFADAGRMKGGAARTRRGAATPLALAQALSHESLPAGRYLLRRTD